jgi:50S ribosomal protein L16 3-hydroxylase
MNTPLGELDTETFLSTYWQKQACVIRQAFPAFEPPLDGNDLAGLACEPLSEARIISGSFPEHDWQVRHGPFEEAEFGDLPETNWTLLVQDVEKHYPPLKSMMQAFRFLPSWRMDDLMISYAVNGGSVGPHVDQYDVFLLQAEGRRHWQISDDFDPAEQPDCELSVLQSFTPQQEWMLEPGDMLYLPPGIAHHGVALEPGMTWSFGFRAPSSADLFQGFGEWLSFKADQGGRYRDPPWCDSTHPEPNQSHLSSGGAPLIPHPGEINAEALEALSRMLQDSLQDEASLRDFFGTYISQFRLAHQPAPPPVLADPDEIVEKLADGFQPVPHPWTRMNWIHQGGHARLYAAGESFTCSVPAARWLCSLPCERSEELPLDRELAVLLASLINAGHLLLSPDDDG